MHLLLIRHGQSKNNILEAAHGAGDAFNARRSVDPPLSEFGERQAKLLGRHLGAQLQRSKGNVRILCSTMTRAMQTAQPLAHVLGLKVEVRPELHEVKGFYDTAGQIAKGPGADEIEARFPQFDASLCPRDGQGGETCAQTIQRAEVVCSLLRTWGAGNSARSEESIVVIVSHNDFINHLARKLLAPMGAEALAATEPDQMFQDSYWPMNNTAISHLIIGVKPPQGSYPANVWLVYWNRSDHLTERDRSGVQFKNVGFCQAAEWARVGEGGSGLSPIFLEYETIASFAPSLRWYALPLIGLSAVGCLLLARRR